MTSSAVLPEVHERALQALQDRLRVLVAREDRVRKALQAVSLERERLEAERAALQLAEQIYLRTLGVPPTEATSNQASLGQRIRARVGPQRYLMLASLRESQIPLKLQEIADKTGLGTKRVKDQLANDEQLGVVKGDWDAYEITDVGGDLLSRFEAYKKSRGEDLPSLSSALDGPDQEEEFD